MSNSFCDDLKTRAWRAAKEREDKQARRAARVQVKRRKLAERKLKKLLKRVGLKMEDVQVEYPEQFEYRYGHGNKWATVRVCDATFYLIVFPLGRVTFNIGANCVDTIESVADLHKYLG